MNIECRISNCCWQGPIGNLWRHCEMWHTKFVKNITKENGFLFEFNDLLEDAFLLKSDNGLYWFLLDPTALDTGIRRGVFAIGNSKICDYTAKIGQSDDESMIFFGPYLTAVDMESFDLEWCYESLELAFRDISTKTLEIYFGNYEFAEDMREYLTPNWSYHDNLRQTSGKYEENDEPPCTFFESDCIACLAESWNSSKCRICTWDIPAHIITDSPASPEDEHTRLFEYEVFQKEFMESSKIENDILELTF